MATILRMISLRLINISNFEYLMGFDVEDTNVLVLPGEHERVIVAVEVREQANGLTLAEALSQHSFFLRIQVHNVIAFVSKRGT